MSENGKDRTPFEAASLEKRYAKLVKIHDAANSAIKNLHGALDLAAAENKILRREVANANQNSLQQKTITANFIAQGEAEKKKLTEEIIGLKAQLRRVT